MASMFGQYKILKKLGQGGMGAVYKARDRKLDRIVALKILNLAQSMSEKSRTRFRREARAMARLEHPHVVSVYTVGEFRGTPYIAMQFVEGRPLSDVLEEGRVSEKQAVLWLTKIAEAVEHAHEKGIVHRDLKPGNVIIDGEGEPRVMDFGLAKEQGAAASLTIEGDVLGTPAYMAPEQVVGDSVDERTDIFSLGGVLYTLLTGKLPFEGRRHSVLYKVVNEEPVLPSSLNSDVDPAVEAVCLKAMQKHPSKRYQDVRELITALRQARHGVQTKRKPIWGRTVATAAACIGVGLVVVWGLISLYRSVASRHTQNLASRSRQESHIGQAEPHGEPPSERSNTPAEAGPQVAKVASPLSAESSKPDSPFPAQTVHPTEIAAESGPLPDEDIPSGPWQVAVVERGTEIFTVDIADDSTGRTYIVYCDAKSSELRCAVGTANKWDIEVVDTGAPDGLGRHCSIAIGMDDVARIAYGSDWRNDKRCLKYAERTLSGTWNAIKVPSASGVDEGYHIILALDSNDAPHIAHWCFQGRHLHKMMYTRRTGARWDTQVVNSTGGPVAFAIQDGHPCVAVIPWGTSDVSYGELNGNKWQFNRVSSGVTGRSIAWDKAGVLHLGGKRDKGPLHLSRDRDGWHEEQIDNAGGSPRLCVDSRGVLHAIMPGRAQTMACALSTPFKRRPGTGKRNP